VTAGSGAGAGSGDGRGAARAPASVRLDEPAGRWIMLATILGSSLAMLDMTVVNIALPALGDEFGASLGGLQWTITAYTLTLAGLILLGGSLGDRYGRRRIFLVGVVWFAVASAMCGFAPTIGVLIAARALQGIGGALLTPGALALIQASFAPGDRARAVGVWSGLGGIAGAVGPFLGGWLVDVDWRLVFLLNLPLAALVLVVAARHVPESSDEETHGGFDIAGAVLAAASLGGLTWALIAAPERGTGAAAAGAAVAGVVAGAAFVAVERRLSRAAPAGRPGAGRIAPMLPLEVFASRQFSAVNVVTLIVYAALGAMFFLLVLQLQVVARFSALAAGTALLPVTLIMLALSARSGALAQRIGPRLPMTVGPLVSACGLLLMTRIGAGASYVWDVLPGVVVFGLGLAATVAPLTATVLATADIRHAGVASGVNNAVARAGGLLAVAGLPAAVGLSGAAYRSPTVFASGFDTAMLICAALLVCGGLLSALTIRSDALRSTPERPCPRPQRAHACPVDGPPLESGRGARPQPESP
jgi:EmrB/QacA subfamily drug resistance transporter